jgi:hypothetical protein
MKQATYQVADYPTKKDLWKHLRSPIADLNDRVPVQLMPVAVTLGDVIKRYEEDVLPGLAKSTRGTDRSMLDVHIKPKWGKTLVTEVYPRVQ